MDLAQTDHLKAYGIVFLNLEKQNKVDWILNYRGGSFLMDYSVAIESECKIRGVYSEIISKDNIQQIYADVDANNMDIVILEKAPKIAVYSPPDKQPWDDAVTLALTYAEVDYHVIFYDSVCYQFI